MAKNKYVIFDANIWIGFYKGQDTLHQKVLIEIEKFKKTGNICLVTNLIIEEVFSVLTYDKNKKLAHQFINFCLNNEKVWWLDMDKNFIEKINKFAQRKNLKNSRMSFTDYSIIFLAKEFDFKVLSFDKELVKKLK